MRNTIAVIVGVLVLNQLPKVNAVTMTYDEGTRCSYNLRQKHAERYLNSVAGNFGQGRTGRADGQSSALTVAASPSSQSGHPKLVSSHDRQINKAVPEAKQKTDKKGSRIDYYTTGGAVMGAASGVALFFVLFPEAAVTALLIGVFGGAIVLAGTALGAALGSLVGWLRASR